MKVRIHLLGNINLICEQDSIEKFTKSCEKNAAKGALIEIEFPNFSSKFINPQHIVAIEEYIELVPAQTVDVDDRK